MMGRMAKTVVAGVLFALSAAACAELTVKLGPPVHYRNPAGDAFTARYGALSDGSLHFVKLRMPDGRTYTLPQAVSASGARYTDERELVWWEHQGTVRVDVRGADGEWEAKYPALREVSGRTKGEQ